MRIDRQPIDGKGQPRKARNFQDETQATLVVDHILDPQTVLRKIPELGIGRSGSRSGGKGPGKAEGIVQVADQSQRLHVLSEHGDQGEGGSPEVGRGNHVDGGQPPRRNGSSQPGGQGKGDKKGRGKAWPGRVRVLDDPPVLDPQGQVIETGPVEGGPVLR